MKGESQKVNHTPELELLLSCARISSQKKDLERRELAFKKGIDESKFLCLVKRHRVMDFVAFHLAEDTRLSQSLRTKIILSNELNKKWAKSYIQLIHQLQDIFDEEKIHGCFIKGMPVGMEIYEGSIFRAGRDIDLWIDKRDFDRFIVRLKAQGFKTMIDFDRLNTKEKNHIITVSRDLSLFKRDKNGFPIVLEVHTSIDNKTGRFSLDNDLSNYTFKKIPFYSKQVSVLDFIDHFLFLVTHGAEHGWRRLKWLFDIVNGMKSFEKEGIKALRERATFIGNKGHLEEAYGLMKYFRLYELSSDSKLEREESIRNLNLIRYFIGSPEGKNLTSFRHKVINLYYQLRVVNSSKLFKLKYYTKYMTSMNDWEILKLPEKLFWMYYFLRPGFVVFRQVKRLSGRK